MNETPAKNRRRFRFSLRTLFVVVTIIGIPLGWLAYNLNWIRQRHEWLKTHLAIDFPDGFEEKVVHIPWMLKQFGEEPQVGMSVPKSEVDRLA